MCLYYLNKEVFWIYKKKSDLLVQMTNNKSGVTLMTRTWVFRIIVKSFFFFFGKHKLSYYVAKKFPTGK